MKIKSNKALNLVEIISKGTRPVRKGTSLAYMEMGLLSPLHPCKWYPNLHLSANTAQVPQADVTHPPWFLVEPSWPEAPASEDEVPLGRHAAVGAAPAALGDRASPARLARRCGV